MKREFDQRLIDRSPLVLEEALMTGSTTLHGINTPVMTVNFKREFAEQADWTMYGKLEDSELMVRVYEYPYFAIMTSTAGKAIIIPNGDVESWPIVELMDLPTL